MGTRADFYIGRGETAEWLGSIALDGYPEGIASEVLTAQSEDAFRKAVDGFLSRDDATRPDQGWPWPWDNSSTTDYAYAFDGEAVHASCFGSAWFDPKEDERDEDSGSKSAVFPDMSDRQNVTLGSRSGVIVVTG